MNAIWQYLLLVMLFENAYIPSHYGNTHMWIIKCHVPDIVVVNVVINTTLNWNRLPTFRFGSSATIQLVYKQPKGYL